MNKAANVVDEVCGDALVECVVRLLRGTHLSANQVDVVVRELNQCLEKHCSKRGIVR